MTLKLILIALAFSLLFSCSSTDDDGESSVVDCVIVSEELDAEITVNPSSNCPGDFAEVTIMGTPFTNISYSNGSTSSTIYLGTTGITTFTVSPESTTTYSLQNIVTSNNCEKILNDSTTLEIIIPPLMESIVGTWSVSGADNSTSEGTVTFFDDNTGTASNPGRFTNFNDATGEFSTGFIWTTTSETIVTFGYIYPSVEVDTLINFNALQLDCFRIKLSDLESASILRKQ